MANKQSSAWLTDEVADFLASCPSVEQLLAYRPSARATRRLEVLTARLKDGRLSADEQWELDQHEHLEILLQSIKARLQPAKRVHA
jgi:hypothetical protein